MSGGLPNPPGDTQVRFGRLPLRVTSAAVSLPPLIRQITRDPLGLGKAAQSRHSRELTPRTKTADRVVQSVCPYCAVGCGQKVYVKDEKVVQIEGDPDSPISRGRLCPKGAASENLVNSPLRETKVKYRRPGGTEWEELELETAMDMIADRFMATRASAIADLHVPLRTGTDIAFLGGIINHIVSNGLEFREYVRHFTNAPVILKEEFRDTDDLGGMFSGWVEDDELYAVSSWGYAG